jgi:hypothetical protein
MKAGQPNENAFTAYLNDSNACSPNGKGPAQGVPGGSSHRGYGGNSLAHANTGESARFVPPTFFLERDDFWRLQIALKRLPHVGEMADYAGQSFLGSLMDEIKGSMSFIITFCCRECRVSGRSALRE